MISNEALQDVSLRGVRREDNPPPSVTGVVVALRANVSVCRNLWLARFIISSGTRRIVYMMRDINHVASLNRRIHSFDPRSHLHRDVVTFARRQKFSVTRYSGFFWIIRCHLPRYSCTCLWCLDNRSGLILKSDLIHWQVLISF